MTFIQNTCITKCLFLFGVKWILTMDILNNEHINIELRNRFALTEICCLIYQ